MTLFVNRLKDIFLQKLSEFINKKAKLECYKTYKSTSKFEPYLDVLNISTFRFVHVNFRTSCHELEIKTGVLTFQE